MHVKTFLKAAVLTVVLLNLPAALAASKELPGHIPDAAKLLKPTGHLSATNVLSLAIGLPLRNQADLNSLMQQIYDPASPLYRQYLTPETFTERFGPAPLDYQQVIAFVQSNGFQIVKTHQNRVLLDVRAKVADIERAFGVHLLTYQHPTEPREFFAPDVEPSVDAGLSIVDISGLDNYGVPHPLLHPTPSGAGNPAAGTGPGGNYWGLDFRHAYAPSVTLTGTGQSVGLVEFEGYYGSDITNYEQSSELPFVSLQNVELDGFTGPNGSDSGGISEVSLDIELAIAMAPGLSSVVVFEAPNSSAYLNDILNAMAASNQIKQFSSSWTFPGVTNGTTDAIFQQMALQGQSFFQASGDGDAWTGAIEQPSDNPYVTVVGGTTLTMNGLGVSYTSETVWNLGHLTNAWPGNGNGYWGSGGGVSTYYSIPSWQQGVNILTNKGSSVMRNIPDVALTANQIWVLYDQGLSNSFVGTSCAAPLWAGYAALINQMAANNGRPSVGFINPAIYALGHTASYLSCFNDITTGNNTNAGSDNLYIACPGYDLCTGWGTPKGLNLITALAIPDALGVLPGNGFSAAWTYGGSFSTNTVFVLTNTGASALTWSGINTAPWLSLTPAGGTLASKAGTTATVSLNSLTATLPPGNYVGTVTFSNTVSTFAQPRQFSLDVSPLELVTNGGFETGDFTDWTLSPADTSYTLVFEGFSYNGVNVSPHSGMYMALLGTDGAQGGISQTLATTPGQTYVLSFWINGTDGYTPNQINANWNNTLVLGETNVAEGWVQVVGFVTANSASSTLGFAYQDDESYIDLDDVSVQPVPPPVFQPVTKAGSTVDFQWYAMTNIVNLAYQLQYKTNLTQTNWLNLGSPILATNLLISTSDISATNRARFYRVVVSP
jgi:subtilase family serine protease